jgi:CBS domain containing-hemolysin-like protein
MIREEADGSWTINAAARVEELEELFDLDLGERDFDTVGGLVVSRLGRVPAAGETLELGDLRIEIRKVERHRIRQVRVRRSGAPDRLRAEP